MKRHLINLSQPCDTVTKQVTANNISMNDLQRFHNCHTFISLSCYTFFLSLCILFYMIYTSIYYYVTNVTLIYIIDNKKVVCHKSVTNLSQCVTVGFSTDENGCDTRRDMRNKTGNEHKRSKIHIFRQIPQKP